MKVEEPTVKIEYVESPSDKIDKLSMPKSNQPIKQMDTEDLQSGFLTPGRSHHRVLPSTVPPPPPQTISTAATTSSTSSLCAESTEISTPVAKGRYVAPVKQELPHKGRVFSPRPPIPLGKNVNPGLVIKPAVANSPGEPQEEEEAESKMDEELAEVEPSDKLEFTMDDDEDFSLDDLNYIDNLSSQSSTQSSQS